MATRTVRALLASLLVLSLVSCDEASDPMAPDAIVDTTAGPDGPATTTPVPAEVAPDLVTNVVTSDPCTISGGPYARFVRRLDSPSFGETTFDSASGWMACNGAPDDTVNRFTWSADGSRFAWSSTVPVGAVILWSGDVGRTYVYSSRSWGNGGLSAPTDPVSGAILPLTAITVCHDYALKVDLQADPRLIRRVDWSMQAQIGPQQWDLFTGEQARSRATVALERGATTDLPPTVYGTVVIRNDSPLQARLSSVTNIISTGIVVPVTLPAPLPIDLAPGESVTATYVRALPDTQPRTNMLTANAIGDVRGGSASTPIRFGERVTENATVTLESSDGQSAGPFDASTTVEFDRAFVADASGPQQVMHPWSVGIVGTGSSIEAQIDVRRHEPRIALRAEGRFVRTWQWALEQGLSTDTIRTASASTEPVRGWLRARALEGDDENFGVMGAASVTNPHPSRGLELNAVQLEIDAASQAVALAPIVAATSTAQADFDVSLLGRATEATLRAQMPLRSFAPDGSSQIVGVRELTGTIALSFDQPTSQRDDVAQVSDTIVGMLGEALASAGEFVVEYEVPLDMSSECGVSSVSGRGELVTDDTFTRVEAPYEILVDIPCDATICTRGKGYWKNHLDDEAWGRTPGGAATALFTSGMTWYEALTRPSRGDAYVRLAAAWVTARLNQLAGADASVVADALAEAAQWLQTHEPDGLDRVATQRAGELANRLQAFNEGEIGPGSCEDGGDGLVSADRMGRMD